MWHSLLYSGSRGSAVLSSRPGLRCSTSADARTADVGHLFKENVSGREGEGREREGKGEGRRGGEEGGVGGRKASGHSPPSPLPFLPSCEERSKALAAEELALSPEQRAAPRRNKDAPDGWARAPELLKRLDKVLPGFRGGMANVNLNMVATKSSEHSF